MNLQDAMLGWMNSEEMKEYKPHLKFGPELKNVLRYKGTCIAVYDPDAAVIEEFWDLTQEWNPSTHVPPRRYPLPPADPSFFSRMKASMDAYDCWLRKVS